MKLKTILGRALKPVRLAPYSWGIVFCCLLFILAIISFWWQAVAKEYARAQMEQTRNTMNLTKAFEEHIHSVLAAADADLLAMKKAYEVSDATHSLLAEYIALKNSPSQTVAAIFDESGRIVEKSRTGPDIPDCSEWEGFALHRANPDDALYIGKPCSGLLTEENTIPLTRCIFKADGSFGGVAYIGLRADYFTEFYRIMEMGPDNLINVMGVDGIVRARQTLDTSASGQNLADGDLVTRARKQRSGTFIAASQIDGIERLRSYRQMAEYPLIVSVGISTDTAFAEAAQHRQFYILTGLLSCLAVLAFGVLLIVWSERLWREKKQLYQSLIGESADAIVLYDREKHCFLDINPQFTILTGYVMEELLDRAAEDLLPEREWKKLLDIVRNGKKGSVRLTCKDGRVINVAPRGSIIRRGGKLLQLVSLRDVTLYERTLADLQQSEEQVRLLLNSTAEAIYGIDMQGNCTFANEACVRILGYNQVADFLGKNMHELIHYAYVDGQRMPVESCRIYQAFHKGDSMHVADEVLWKMDGTSFPAEYWSYPQYREDQVVGAVVTFFDITERKGLEEKILHLANHDALTGLPTRRLFLDRLLMARSMARRHQGKMAVLFVDLDAFKAVNDTYGHAAGDQVLKVVAEKIKAVLRETDTVARIGGDEFSIVLNELQTDEDAADLAERIIRLISEPIQVNSHAAAVGASVGIAVYPDDGETPEQLLELADQAMYEVKKSGKNNYAFYRAGHSQPG